MDKQAELASANQILQAELFCCQQELKALRSQLELEKAIFNAANVLVMVVDVQGYIVRCNSAWEEATGYTSEQLPNQPFWNIFISAESKETVKADLAQIKSDNKAIICDQNWLTKSTNCRITWSYTPFSAPNGTLKYVIATGSNVRQNQQLLAAFPEAELESQVQEQTAELAQADRALQVEMVERQRTEEKLRFSETRFRTLFEQSLQSIEIFTPDGRWLQGNQAWVELFGVTQEEFVAVNFNLLEDQQLVEKGAILYIQKAFAGEATTLPPVFYDSSRRKINGGRTRWLQTVTYPLKDEAGNVREVVLVHTDVTELKQSEQELQARAAQLEETNHLLRILEATASAANALLTVDNFDEAVNTAVQIIGETLDTDRVCVGEHHDDPAGKTLEYVRYLYEWDSPHVVRQIEQPGFVEISYEGIEQLYFLGSQGYIIGGLIDEMPEPFRSAQKQLGVQSSYAVPIMVGGKYWGVMGFDDCREAKRRSAAELTVVKTAAACIGSAIQRERSQQALLQVEQARAQELERINTQLQQALDRLAESEERYRTLFELSSEGILRFGYKHPIPITLPVDEQLDLCYQSIYIAEGNNAFAKMYEYEKAEDMIGLTLSDLHNRDSEVTQTTMQTWIENCYSCQSLETVEIDRQGCQRYFLNSSSSTLKNGCVVSTWVSQVEITQLRETQQALLCTEQERVAELAKVNEELRQRDRLLSVVAQVTKDLLETEDVETAISSALQTVGEAANMSRVLLILERQNSATQQLKHCVEAEWVASGISDHAAVDMAVMDNENFQVLIQPLYAGQSIWRVMAELPDVTRSQFERLNIKSTGVVPIFIERQYIGCVGFDDCIVPRYWTQQEIDVLTTAAESIGAALHRKQLVDRLIAERLQAEQDRVAELSKTNTALKNSLDRLAANPDLNAFLGHVLLEVVQQFQVELGYLNLYNADSQTLPLHLYIKHGQVQLQPELEVPVALLKPAIADLPIWETLLQTRQPLVITRENGVEYVLQGTYDWQVQQQNHHTGINLLLTLQNEPIGLLELISTRRSFSPEELELAQALANQVTLALQLTRLAEEAKQAVILDERNRMTREIHDTLAQAFTGIVVHLEGTKRKLGLNKLDEAQTHLLHAGNLARDGLSEARRSVWALRPEVLESHDLPNALRHLAQQMTADTTVRTQVWIEGTRCDLPPEVEMNLLRIAQEALTNVLKYAKAQSVRIELLFEAGAVHLHIIDDGQGFNKQQQIYRSGFGLISMQERVQRLGGQLTITSRVGVGTEISVTVPTP